MTFPLQFFIFFILIFDAIFVRFRLSITFLSDINPAYTLARCSLLVWGAWGCWTCTLITAWLEEDSLSEDDVSSPLLITGVFSVRDWTMSCNSATRLAFSFFTFFFLIYVSFCHPMFSLQVLADAAEAWFYKPGICGRSGRNVGTSPSSLRPDAPWIYTRYRPFS